MILVARGTRGLQGWNISVQEDVLKVYFHLNRVEEQRRLSGFLQDKCSPQKALCLREGGWSAHEGGMWMEASSRAIQPLS